jgi:hypothetical protein
MTKVFKTACCTYLYGSYLLSSLINCSVYMANSCSVWAPFGSTFVYMCGMSCVYRYGSQRVISQSHIKVASLFVLFVAVTLL